MHEVQAALSLVAPVAEPYFPTGQDEGHAVASVVALTTFPNFPRGQGVHEVVPNDPAGQVCAIAC